MSAHMETPMVIDSIVKSLFERYKIPSVDDIQRLTEKIEHLEELLASYENRLADKGPLGLPAPPKGGETSASAMVMKVIKNSKNGADFRLIRNETGFHDKKIRNIIFRLNKIGKIKRASRGIYVVI